MVAAAPKSPFMNEDGSWNKDAVMNHICERTSTEVRAITKIISDGKDGFKLPCYNTIVQWFEEDPFTEKRYSRAKAAQMDLLGEEFLEQHKKALVPVLDANGIPCLDKHGEMIMTVSKESAALARLEADNKKWLMGKLKPKKYGERLQVAGDAESPLIGAVAMLPADPVAAAEAYQKLVNGK